MNSNARFRSTMLLAGMLVLTCSFGQTAQSAEDKKPLTFEEHIRPIFRAHCYDCHGAAETFEGSLDLRLVRFMEKGGDSGAAIVPGKPDESYLLDRVSNGEMPPGEGRISEAEVTTLREWIAQGAPTARPEPESIGPGLGITPEERNFWSFQPIQRPDVPNFPENPRVRTPIDAFLLKAMPEGFTFSADADRFTLVKRLYFNLIGLPPSPAEMQRWLSDSGDDWYTRLVDELLDSPHYGERWARHWLDVAGYADSEGFTTRDEERGWAWKYRDYVIRAFNHDKPFDRFITEQLAGDELAGPRNGDLTPEQKELLAATGFLRMSADGTGSGANTPEARNQVMIDTLRIVSSSLLGMSVACAQCHDHRYDPIPQTDYYALRAVFEPALDWNKWQTPPQRLVSLYTQADREKAAEIEAEAQKVAAERSAKQAEYMAQALDKELMKYEEPLRAQLRTAYETPGDKRNEEQKALLKKYPSVNITPGVLYQYLPDAAEDLKKYDARINEIRAKKPPEEFLRALVEPAGHVPETRLFHRGDFQQPKQTVMPAALTVTAPEHQRVEFPVNDESLPTTGRRLAFARWLTSGEHPLVGRVLVNRVWMHHFGRGLVATPADFGRLGVEPTHPELLDWLASELVQQGWSLKSLHRLILHSTAWRQSSYRDPEMNARDPDNNYYWRKSVVRLEAEALRDRMIEVVGQLDRTVYGPPLAVQEDEAGQVIVAGEQTRRSLYIRARRSQPVAMLQAFDAPVMETNCEKRPVSTVSTQSLLLMNGEFTLKQSQRLAERAAKEAQPLAPETLAILSPLPEPTAAWSFGYGQYAEASQRTGSFTPLPHWTGSAWQGGPELPNPQLGWVLLTANGGHPGRPEVSCIRRWTAPAAGVVSITGRLQHGSEDGNGVRGRIVSNRVGLAGEWTVHHNAAETKVDALEVQQGDTVDFITDCIDDHGFDSFGWPVTISFKNSDGVTEQYESTSGFHGPISGSESLPGQMVRAWELALCRPPSEEELKLAMEFAGSQLRQMRQMPDNLPKDVTPRQQILTNLCQVLLTSNEFLYVD